MLQNIIFDMGNVLLTFDPEVPLARFCHSEEAKDLIRKELFQGPEWIMGIRVSSVMMSAMSLSVTESLPFITGSLLTA